MYKINKVGKHDYIFYCNNILVDHYSNVKCDYCNRFNLDPIYVIIITSLQKNNLLPKDYKLICCFCSNSLKKLANS